ncbi:MAG: tetratricopeptide repeat protein [Bacteroidales bacterium]|nr:tetratricopeptide repeat protein [Bacteroidales bacterium]
MKISKICLVIGVFVSSISFCCAQQEQMYKMSVTVKDNDSVVARNDADAKLTQKAAASIYSDILYRKLFANEAVKADANKDRVLSIIASNVQIDLLDASWDGKKCSLKGMVNTDIYLLAKTVEEQFCNPSEGTSAAAQTNASSNGNGNGGAASITIINPDNSTVEISGNGSSSAKKELTEQEMEATSTYLKQAMTAEASKNYRSAVENYNKAIELNPGEAGPYFNLGNAYYKMEQYDEAIAAYNKSLDIRPDNADVLYNLGNAYLDKRDMGNAISTYEKVVKLVPTNADAYYNLSAAYFEFGDKDNAVEAMKNAARNGSKNAQLWLSANKISW